MSRIQTMPYAMRPKLYWPLLMVFMVLTGCGSEEAPKEPVLRPVKYQSVSRADAANQRSFSGVAKAANEVNLSFRSGGIITEINVKKGQTVKKGTLIARLDNVEANLAYEKSISSLNSAESAMNTAKAELERVKSLYEKRSVSLSDYEAAKNSYQNALAQFESAKRNKSIQKTQVNYGYIYAPNDGVIADTDGEVNENVPAGHRFAILNAGTTMKIEVGLPESVINLAELGMKAEVTCSALEGQVFSGVVSSITPIVAENAATYPVDVEIVGDAEAIKTGMAASVSFEFGKVDSSRSQAIIIPIKAVGEDGTGNYVFLIESENGETGKVTRKHVELGELTSVGFEVKSGLTEGQLIATAGLQTLLEGQEVRLK